MLSLKVIEHTFSVVDNETEITKEKKRKKKKKISTRRFGLSQTVATARARPGSKWKCVLSASRITNELLTTIH